MILKNIFLFYFSFAFLLAASGQSYIPVLLTGFNVDAVYNTGETFGAHAALDSDGWAYYSTGIKAQGGLTQSLVSRSGVNYQLSSFNDKNVFFIGVGGAKTGILTFVNPIKTNQLWVLGLTATQTNPISFVVKYSDGTSSTAIEQTFPDWYQSSKDRTAIYGLSRIMVRAGATQGNFDDRLQFGLFERIIPTNPAKNIVSVSLTIADGSYATIFAISASDITQPKPTDNTLYYISDAHLDTQWNWTVKTTIDEYIPNTLKQNFALFEAYPNYHFNFEGAIKYMWMKEYYPEDFAKLKEYVNSGRWTISGGSVDADDVMIPSAESIIRNFLYGQTFYKKEFGRKGGTDIMLPDCFGFPYSLPTLGKHCGVTGFHSQKLSWGSAYNYDELPPLCRWKGIDGSEIYALLKLGSYTNQDLYKKDMSFDTDILSEIITNKENSGVPATFRYIGTGDRGGAMSSETADWVETSIKGLGPVTVKMTSPEKAFEIMAEYKDNLPVIDHELPMRTHGVGCYTSQAILKYWNRKNELLADATEKSSVVADWLGGLKYQSETIKNAWIRLLWHQFHDDITGTSIPQAYGFSYNDQILTQMDLSKTLTNAVGAVARNMSTSGVTGIPIVVNNPLSIERNDIVTSTISVDSQPSAINVLDKDGISVPVQMTEYLNGQLTFIFLATVPSLGYATYDVHLNETSTATVTSSLSVTTNTLENDAYKITINTSGDVSSILDKKQSNKELLKSPIRLAMLYDESTAWPSWEIQYNTLQSSPREYADENVKVSIAENGSLRAALKITRTKAGSEFVQYVRLVSQGSVDRIDFTNEVNWQTKERLLKAEFPLNVSNTMATYDLSIGAIERPNSNADLYEVAGHQWADLTNSDNVYGVSILNDCKYGWDKPNDNTLRLSLIHTPKVSNNYTYESSQDLGLNKFTFSIYRHLGKWNVQTQWEAAKLNQPLLAFQMPKHEGSLGTSFEFAKLNTDKVAIKALKKAENSEDLIVRVYELTGNAQDNVEISFPTNILSAIEVNGLEEEVGAASFTNNKLLLSLTKFQPKTFSVKLASPATPTVQPVSAAVTIPYNMDVMSFDTKKTDGAFAESGSVYPAELIADQVVSDGITFTMGSRVDGAKNAIRCQGQTILLPQGGHSSKMYLLAASQKYEGSTANFGIDDVSVPLKVGYFADFIGQWGTVFSPRFYRQENAALTLTHRHDVKSNTNMSYQYLYMFKYLIPISSDAQTLTLPNDPDILVFAITLSDNTNDDVIPVSEVSNLPVSKDIVNEEPVPCGTKLIPVKITASAYTNESESPQMVADNNPFTKWCDNKSTIKWIDLDFGRKVEVCQWNVIHAGIESLSMITSDFRLQYYNENNVLVNSDIVTGNTANNTIRFVTPFQTSKVRLFLDKEGQAKGTARIYSFDVFGKDVSTGIEVPVGSNGGYTSNYPNPFGKSTLINCSVPDNTTDLTVLVYDMKGSMVDTSVYPVSNGGVQEITWHNRSCKDGIYFYTLFANQSGVILQRNHGKLIISNSLN